MALKTGNLVQAAGKYNSTPPTPSSGDVEELQLNEDGSLFVKRGMKANNTAVVRAASGALTAGESTTAVTGLEEYTHAVLRLDVTTITTPDADDEIDFYIQTSYNGGTDWADLENVHFALADNGTTAKKLMVIGALNDAPATPVDETDGTLADNTQNDLPLGDRIRIKTAVTGATAPTYAYNAEISLKA